MANVWYQVRKNIGDMRHTLPQGTVGPFFNDDFGSTFGIIYAFTADGFTFRELRDHVEAARSRLLQVPDVSKIEVLGAQDEQIYIEFSAERLAGLRLNLSSILATLQAQNLVRPSGTIQTENERVFLRVTGAFDSERDIEAVNIVVGERIFRLGDIATVRRGFVDPPQPMFRVNGQPAIGLAIAMRDAGDILTLGENVRSEMADIQANLPVGIEPMLVADQAVTVDVAINDFMTSLWQAIVIILVCSFVSLGVRPGAVVALAIPFTLAIVFAVMDVANIDLHRISLGALIIALTLLVDDAMTTVDAMIRRLGAGDTSDQAATFAYRTLAAPMLIGTLVTIASFVPDRLCAELGRRVHLLDLLGGRHLADRLLAGGGDLRADHRQGAAQARPRSRPTPSRASCSACYSSFLQGAIRMRWVTIALTLAAFAVALFLLRFVPQQFFPASDRPELTVDLTLRQNASIHATEAQAERLEALLKADPDVDHFSTYVGRGAIRFILTLNVQLANPFFAQFVVVAKDIEARERLQLKLEKALAEQFPDVVARVSPLELGPPVGWPLQYRVIGPDKDEVRRISLELAQAHGRRHAHAASSTSTGWSRRGSCASRSTRTRRASSASARRRSPACSTAPSPAPASRRCATTSTSSTSWRVRPTASAASFETLSSLQVPDAERAHGAAEAVRDLRRGAGVPAGLAPRPRADADRARRREPWRAARFAW